MMNHTELAELEVKAFIVDMMAQLEPNESLDDNLNKMLKALGEVSGADRTYIFELDKGDYVENTYEWCREGIEPRIDRIHAVPKDRLNGWMHLFGNQKPLILSSPEQIRENMPEEYEMVMAMQIETCIAVPIFLGENVFAIFGLENADLTLFCPQESTLQYLGRQFALVYDRERLNHKNMAFIAGMRSSNLTEILVDYPNNYYEIFRLTKPLQGRIPEMGQWQWIRRFYAGIVEPIYQDEILRKTDDAYLEGHLNAEQSNFAIDVERVVDEISHWFRLEFSVASLNEQGGLERFLLVCKDVTQMKREEEEYQQLITALSSFYRSSFMIDLVHGTAHPIKLSNNMEDALRSSDLSHTEVLERFVTQLVESHYQDIVREFMDIDTMSQRLSDTDILTCEYHGTKIKWGRIILTPAKRNQDGIVEKVVFAVQDIEKEKNREEWMQYRIEHDALTGVLNRAAFNRVIKVLEGKDNPFALVVLDIDKFKDINDTYGHDVGDLILKKFSTCMNECFRASDKIFRLGGDEFAVLMNYITKKDAKQINKIITGINNKCGDGTDGLPVFSVSAGAAFSEKGYSEIIYRNADKALYHTKKTTRKGCTIFEEMEL